MKSIKQFGMTNKETRQVYNEISVAKFTKLSPEVYKEILWANSFYVAVFVDIVC